MYPSLKVDQLWNKNWKKNLNRKYQLQNQRLRRLKKQKNRLLMSAQKWMVVLLILSWGRMSTLPRLKIRWKKLLRLLQKLTVLWRNLQEILNINLKIISNRKNSWNKNYKQNKYILKYYSYKERKSKRKMKRIKRN